MIEKAYRSAGLPLSEPLPIRSLPKYHRHRLLGVLIEGLTAIRLDTPVFVPGNEHYGTYASPFLETVYVTAEAASVAEDREAPGALTPGAASTSASGSPIGHPPSDVAGVVVIMPIFARPSTCLTRARHQAAMASEPRATTRGPTATPPHAPGRQAAAPRAAPTQVPAANGCRRAHATARRNAWGGRTRTGRPVR